MAITVRSNPQSIFSQTRLTRTSRALEKTFNRLSSGSRINTAADDAAGLATRPASSTASRASRRQAKRAGDQLYPDPRGRRGADPGYAASFAYWVCAANETLTDTVRRRTLNSSSC